MDEQTKTILNDKIRDRLKRLGLKVPFILIFGFLAINVLTRDNVLVSRQVDGIIFGVLLVPTVGLFFYCLLDVMTINTFRGVLNGHTKTTESLKEEESGKVYLNESNEIVWTRDNNVLTKINIEEIKVIGEYTTANGPFIDDWFYLYILGTNDIRQISAYAQGTKEVLTKLGEKLNIDLKPRLVASTKWETNILWPTDLVGQKVFKEISTEPSEFIEKVKAKLGLADKKWDLTENVKKSVG
jgi:hypothetical protein